MPNLVGWQLFYSKPGEARSELISEVGRLRRINHLGIFVAATCATGYAVHLPPNTRQLLTSSFAIPWGVVTIVGIVLQFAGWQIQKSNAKAAKLGLLTVSAGTGAVLLGSACLREVVRLSTADIDQLQTSARAAGDIAGFIPFLYFAVFNAVAIGVCIRLVRKRTSPSS